METNIDVDDDLMHEAMKASKSGQAARRQSTTAVIVDLHGFAAPVRGARGRPEGLQPRIQGRLKAAPTTSRGGSEDPQLRTTASGPTTV
jgi:hypothetical protein